MCVWSYSLSKCSVDDVLKVSLLYLRPLSTATVVVGNVWEILNLEREGGGVADKVFKLEI